jgi:hypothetical protein
MRFTFKAQLQLYVRVNPRRLICGKKCLRSRGATPAAKTSRDESRGDFMRNSFGVVL